MESQNHRKSHLHSQEALEHEIHRLKDMLDKKEYEFTDYMSQAKRITAESQYEISRLRDEKEKLKSEILLIESAKKTQV